MKLIVVERRTYEVPSDLEEDVRDALSNFDREALEEVVGDIENRDGVHDLVTISMTPIERKHGEDVEGTKLEW